MERVRQFQSKLKYIYVMILATIIILSIQSNIVYATEQHVDVEAQYADGQSIIPSGGGKWYSTYCKNAGYQGQGILVYMLEKDGGAVTGVTPKAFACSEDMKSIELSGNMTAAKDAYEKLDTMVFSGALDDGNPSHMYTGNEGIDRQVRKYLAVLCNACNKIDTLKREITGDKVTLIL